MEDGDGAQRRRKETENEYGVIARRARVSLLGGWMDGLPVLC
jgi:hypothetical protein